MEDLKTKEKEYTAFLNQKIDTARASMYAGVGESNEKIEAEFSKRYSK